MADRVLHVPPGYDAEAHPRVASFAAQLDDQLRRLRERTADLEVRHLEWQPCPGTNTAGMLLAHLAVVDVWWIQLAPHGITPEDGNATMKKIIGIEMEDDGLPLPPDGAHPRSLAGRTFADYLGMLDAARTATHSALSTWRDSDLPLTFPLREKRISREWTLYHVLEHFAAHSGQVLLLRHWMRDAGLLPREAN